MNNSLWRSLAVIEFVAVVCLAIAVALLTFELSSANRRIEALEEAEVQLAHDVSENASSINKLANASMNNSDAIYSLSSTIRQIDGFIKERP